MDDVVPEVVETDSLPDPRVRPRALRPAWEVGPHLQAGAKQVQDYNIVKKEAEWGGVPTFIDSAKRAFRSGDNFGVMIGRQIDRAYQSGPQDPDWDNRKEDWLKANRKLIDEHQDWRYLQTRNQLEADALLADQQLWAEDQRVLARRGGFSTFVAQGLAGIFDIDTPISFMTGGLSSASKLAIMSSKAARIGTGAVTGSATAMTAAGAGFLADPNSDWTVIPLSGLAGMAFGGAGAALSRNPQMIARNKVLEDFSEHINDGMPRANENLHREVIENTDPYHSEAFDRQLAQAVEESLAAEKAAKPAGEAAKPKSFDVNELDPAIAPDHEQPRVYQPGETSGDAGSINARNLGTQGPGIGSIKSTRIQDMIITARGRVQQLGIHQDWLDSWQGKGGAIGRYAQRFQEVVNNSPIASDFARMMNSGSAVAQTVAYDLLENASGIVRNGRSAARAMEHYHKQLLAPFTAFEDNYAQWAAAQKVGMWERTWNTTLRDRYNREVAFELQGRLYDGPNHVPNPNQSIVKAADAIDRVHAKEVEVLQGRAGEMAVKGAQYLKKRSGYMQQKWLGRNILRLQETGVTRDMIVEAMAEGYRNLHRTMSQADARVYAKAVLDRAERADAGKNTSLIGVLQEDGRYELADTLRRQANAMPEHEIQSFIDRIQGQMELRGQPAQTKPRLDIDLRFVASNGVRIADLVDLDFQSMIPRRMRRSAGQGALARKGIASRQDWNDIKEAIKQEQKANGPSQKYGQTIKDKIDDYIDSDKHLDDRFLDELYTYFSGDPIAGGLSPMVSRIKKLTNLALLNQLGLTNLAEFGPTIAAVGIEQFFRQAGEAVASSLRKVDSDLVKELKHMNILVPEEKLFRDDLVHEFEKATNQGEWSRGADRILNKASRLQGYTSGFYAIRNLQQRIAVTSAADRLAKHFRDGGLISDERLFDMGLGNKVELQNLKNYVDHGIVEFDADGNLLRLNLDQWAPEEADMFSYTLNAATNTLVQKAMAGESSMLFHRDGLASLFWHLKSFPMLALEKQALRHARIMDAQAATTFLYGLATAAAVYTMRQALNGRTDRLEWTDIARGAFGQSNMTGWIPMWTDPLAGMLGLDGLQVGGHAAMGNAVISTPAAFSTLDRMAQIPGAIGSSVVNLGPTNGDINALTAMPLIGNAYGFALMFNLLKQANKDK